MANEENLKNGIKTQYRSGEEAARNGQKGGLNSGKSRRRKKAMKKRLEEALECGVINPSVRKMIRQVGMDDTDSNNYDAVVASIVVGAIKGNPRYAQLLMELIGETGAEKRAERSDKRDAKRLRMQEAEFQQKHDGNTKDNDMVMQFIEEMKHDKSEQKTN